MNTPPLVTIQAQRDHLAYCQSSLEQARREVAAGYWPISALKTREQTVRREMKYLRELERKQAQQEATQ